MPQMPERLKTVNQTIDSLLTQLGPEGLTIELARRGILSPISSIESCSMEKVLWEYQEWLEFAPITEATKTTYESEVRQFKAFLFAERMLESDADAVLVEQIYSNYLRRSMAPTTRNKKIGVLRNLHKFAVRQKWLDTPVPAILKTEVVPPSIPRALSPEAVEELLDLARMTRYGHRYYCLVAMMLATGARIGEVASLTMENVHLDRYEATVKGKNHPNGRTVYFGEEVRDLLQNYIEITYGVGALSKSSYTESYVFSACGRGTKPDVGSIQETFRKIVNKMRTVTEEEKEHLTPHALRHTFATTGLEHGIDLYTLSQLLGHKNVSTTTIYAHVSDRRKRDAVEETQRNLRVGWR